jgi:GxxExxY protein
MRRSDDAREGRSKRSENLRYHRSRYGSPQATWLCFLEPVYQEAMAIELSKRQIPFSREVRLPVFYKEMRLNTPYRVDFICFDEVAVELKALAVLSGTEEAQLINYLKASGRETGLLLNFGARSLMYKRFILSNNKKSV